jgi:hypothetical protein
MQLGGVNGFAAWRVTARERLAAGVRPDEVAWSDWKAASLFAEPARKLGRERTLLTADCGESPGSAPGIFGPPLHIPRELLACAIVMLSVGI